MASELLISSIEIAGGGTLEVWAEETATGVTFHIKTGDGWNSDYNLDLNGLFLEYAEGGSIKLTVDGEKANNLNGTTYEGAKIYWDVAESTGSTVGGSDGQTSLMEAYVTVDGLTLEAIDGGLVGIRATSTGLDGEGSLKLVGEITVPDEPPPVDNFENNGHALSYVTFYFDTTNGDTKGVYDGEPSRGTNTPDGVYTVKVNFDGDFSGNSGDFDDYYAQLLQAIIATDANVDENTVVLGVAIHAGEGDPKLYEDFYALDGDPQPELYPDPPVDPAIANEVDKVYTMEALGITTSELGIGA